MSADNNKDMSPLQMQDRVQDRFRSQDLELLKTGQFSDARLTLDGKIWNVHKSIVCLRSAYMKSAFTPGPTARRDELVITGHSRKQVDLLLEFIYSGSTYEPNATAGRRQLRLICHADINTVDDLSLDQCVKLCGMGRVFGVDGMVCHAVTTLWHKLTPMLRTLSSTRVPASRNTDKSWTTIVDNLDHLRFIADFEVAVCVAYWDDDNACQLVLADFVWAARTWLLCDPIIHKLNNLHPRFGNHVLTTVAKGPQSPVLRAEKLL